MGLLDRFKKAPGPDAMTWEAVARLRVVPGVAGAEAVDADTVEIAWADNPYPSTLSLVAARDAGLSYLAITDHSQALAMANGLDETRALEHARTVRALNERLEGITLLAGIECDIRPDGSMDLADDCLAQLDIVIASVHSAFNQEPEQMTERILRAIACPWVDVIAHPTGRLILKREPYKLAFERIVAAAAASTGAASCSARPSPSSSARSPRGSSRSSAPPRMWWHASAPRRSRTTSSRSAAP